ncbi:MAG: tyrosine-type recombinase/integrase [Dechloromonas sp.]|nr:MAG: tyrosine-type recombinase/integrase [Dechloromonas sp.]
MSKIPSLHPVLQGWLLDGPLAAYVSAYLERLERGRYASSTSRRCLNAVAHFAHWMSLCRLLVARLDESRIDQFLQEHLPHCGCRGPVTRHPREAHAALMPLLAILRQRGVIADLPTPSGPITEELSRYDAHMLDTRGLASGTRSVRLRIIERLLVHKFAGHTLDLHKLQPQDIRRFVAEQLELRNTISNAVTINAALRGYLRWRATYGDSVQALLGVIASPANWTHASLPRALQSSEVGRVLNPFTQALRSPKRGYAIVRLALDLGLRCIEINRLQLDDIDWQHGTLTLRRTKSRRQDVLPLPVPTGKALEPYLQHERPLTSNRSLFVRSLAPHDSPVSVHAIRRVIRDAFRRAGIAHGRAHALRHTLACRLVNSGVSIKEVADVLRHRSLNISLIYAKTDHAGLVEVALPWPGSPA